MDRRLSRFLCQTESPLRTEINCDSFIVSRVDYYIVAPRSFRLTGDNFPKGAIGAQTNQVRTMDPENCTSGREGIRRASSKMHRRQTPSRGSFSDFRSFEEENDPPSCIYPPLLSLPSHWNQVRQLCASGVAIFPLLHTFHYVTILEARS